MMFNTCIVFVELFVIISVLSLQELAGFNLRSLSAASVLSNFKTKDTDLTLYRTTLRFTLLQDDHALSPSSTPTSFGYKRHQMVADAPHPQPSHYRSPAHGPSSGAHNNHLNISSNAHSPSISTSHHPGKGWRHGSASSPSVLPHKYHYSRKKGHRVAPETFYRNKGSVVSPCPSPLSSAESWRSRRSIPLPEIPPDHSSMPIPPPAVSPMSSATEKKKKHYPPQQEMTLPPPPPNLECTSVSCTEPLTYTPPGAPCGCVLPIEVKLQFGISLYEFFPSVSELANEISASLLLDRSQVRIMGADATNQQLEKITVLINLVPPAGDFKAAMAFSIYTKFWRREVSINTSVFGAYEVVYVRYPGVPPSPPLAASSATIDKRPYPGYSSDGVPRKPLGVDVPRHRKSGTSKNVTVVVILSSVTAFVVCMGFIWLLLLKCGCCNSRRKQSPHIITSSEGKPSGGIRYSTFRSRPSSTSMSFSSSLMAYTGTAKIFNIDDIERATDNFNRSRILGEGGFGLVYGGILDDGRAVAVKVLKRTDQQGSREFLAEVEMLSRLHHRNLVKLIGICPEEKERCLVYELVPNGSVESHLHGPDKEVSPLDWCARMKIALGSARGLAYLHEDSSPRVIHRDFKSSNILLEHDFTPKVSDFGLARTAFDEGNKHISTHVMGTFGYLAPEYAMTGHLLVKSDVYSYGVVLLELLTGRKPVDLSQPPGQENLVAWARPLLATKEGLETILDPDLKSNVPLDSISKVAAIASMCVQPEVSHRPFMGEVVQALKLVCNEFEETREPMSRTCSQEDFSIEIESKHSRTSNELMDNLDSSYRLHGFDSAFDAKVALSAMDLKDASMAYQQQESESFRRQFNSAPLKMEKKRPFWQRLRGLSRGSMNED